MTSAWWAAFGPAETSISCGGGQHLLRWADGALQAADHPDAEGELVIAALGGDATPCLDLVQLWGAYSDDLAVLAVGPRSASDSLTVTAAVLEELGGGSGGVSWLSHSSGPSTRVINRHGVGTVQFTQGWSGSAPAPTAIAHLRSGGRFARSRQAYGRARPAGLHRHPRRWPGGDDGPSRAPLLALLALGAPFQWRLAGAVAHAWSAEGPRGANLGRARPALTAALAGRLAPAASRWLGVDPAQVEVGIHDEDGWGEVSVGARDLRAMLPVSWLARVWAPGLAVVDGYLVVGVADAAWPRATVLALAPGGKPVELTVRSDGREWSEAR